MIGPAASRAVASRSEPGSAAAAERLPVVVPMENHDAALHVWREHAIEGGILVHVDAHHDMRWLPDRSPVTIADYICPALKERIVREVHWIVPDPMWRRERRGIRRRLREIARKYPGSDSRFDENDSHIRATVMGRPLVIGPIDSLPVFADRVLLDIDTDFMVEPIRFGGRDPRRCVPWCWPSALVDRLAARGVRSDLITIAFSVEGGYTPLTWKFLGDEVAARVSGAGARPLAGFAALRRGALHEAAGAIADAEAAYVEAEAHLPSHAAPPFRLSRLFADQRRFDRARDAFARAVDRDATYRTWYRNSGLTCLTCGFPREAEAEYRLALAVDPADAGALYGLGCLAARDRRWSDAEGLLRQSMALDERYLDARRELARVLRRLGRDREARAEYEQSLSLALRGRLSFGSSISTAGGTGPVSDPGHLRVYTEIGRLQARAGDLSGAAISFKIGSAGGGDVARAEWHLSRLDASRGQWRSSLRHLWRAAIRFPPDLRRNARAWWRTWRLPRRRAFRAG